MSIPRSTRAVVATAAIAVLAGCSGGAQFAPGASQQSLQQHAVAPQIPSAEAVSLAGKAKKPTPLIFAADEGSRTQAGAVYAYLNSGSGQSPIWSIGSPLKYPAGLWVDGSLNLYVADQAGFVYEYNAPNSSGPPSGPSFTYTDAGYLPNHVAVCGTWLYASDLTGPDGYAHVTVWKIGTAAPALIISNSNYDGPGAGYGVTCDSKGKLYFGYDSSYAGPGAMDTYPAGGTGSPTTTNLSPAYLEGLTFNKKYTILVLGDGYNSKGPAIEFWSPTGKSPSHIIVASWISSPLGFAYETGDQYLWDADSGNGSIHRFKTNGTLVNTITSIGSGKTFASIADVAFSPPDHK